ncbi:MAG: lysylphosphatidylglycerol synthase transmembrane domain-containing protein [Isosphaeraceae bacterium]
MKSPRHTRFQPIAHGILAVIGLGLLAMVLWRDRGPIGDLADRRPDLPLLALSLLLMQLNLVVVFGRWAILVRVLDRRISVRTSIFLGFIGYLFNLAIPGAVGGDVVKAAYLSRMQIKRTQAIASMIMDRVLGLLGLLGLAALAGALAWNPATTGVRRLILAASAMLGGGLFLVTMLFAREPIWNLALRASRFPSRWSNIASELSAMSSTYRQRPGAILMGLVLSVLSHGLTVLVFFLLGKALFGAGMAATLGHHFLMVPLILLTMAVPLPFGALGLSEEVGSHLLGMVGHPSGAVVMMALRVLMIACGLEGACVYLLGFKELRTLTAAAGDLPTSPTLEQVVDDQKTRPRPNIPGTPCSILRSEA